MAAYKNIFLLLLALSVLFSFANGICGPPSDDDLSQQRTDMSDDNSERNLENAGNFGGIHVSCETNESTSGSDNSSSGTLKIVLSFFFVVAIVVAGCYFIWLHKQKSAAAAAVHNSYPGAEVSINIGPEKQFPPQQK